MTDDYTPTLDEVRGAAVRGIGSDWFDRWLAAHEEAVRADERKKCTRAHAEYIAAQVVREMREREFTFSPPRGWFVFGTHVGEDVRLEFWGEQFSEDGLPIWERPVEPEWEYGVTGPTGDVASVRDTREAAEDALRYWRDKINSPNSRIVRRRPGRKPGKWEEVEQGEKR